MDNNSTHSPVQGHTQAHKQAHAQSDIQNHSWILRRAPRTWRPYIRLARMDRPIGTWLLLLPCWWAIALASTGLFHTQGLSGADLWPQVRLMALFALGALVMRGAGCTINDIVDRNIDARVARTASRPIPGGEVSVMQATGFLIVLLLLGLVVLMQLNTLARLLALSSLGLVFLYPFAKCVTNWPQLVLGLAINWGVLVGWAAVRGTLHWPALVLYAGGVFWTLGYDTIYAYQDKTDDAGIGVKSTTFALGENPRCWLLGFYAVTVAALALSGSLAGSLAAFQTVWHMALFYGGVGGCAAHLVWQVWSLDIHSPASCRARFLANRDFGLAVFAVLVVRAFMG